MGTSTRQRAAKPAPDLLSTTEAAELLNVSKRTIFRLITEGDLPAYRLGRSGRAIRLHRVDVLALVRRVA